MSSLEALKSAQTLSDVARILTFKPSALSYWIIKQHSANKYSTFEMPKRSGGTRTIKAPAEQLKLIQERLSAVLQDCLAEINKATNPKDNIAHGFMRGLSIITNAREHRKRRWVFNLDLQDFFPSINFGRVRGYFIQNRNFKLTPAVATGVSLEVQNENGWIYGTAPFEPGISLAGGAFDGRHVVIRTGFQPD